MEDKILYQGAAPIVDIHLRRGESLKAESGAMVYMSSTIDVDGKMEGGFLGGVTRMLAGEKFFFQTLKATRGDGVVGIAPAALGAIEEIELDGSFGLCVQKDGFLAGTEGINVETKMQNLAQGLFSGEGFFILNISGRGKVFINSLGSIHAINLEQGEEILIDNSHLVAWPNYMNYRVEKASNGWISSFTSGEGLVLRFTGPGPVLIQTRNPQAFGSWITKFVPNGNGNGNKGGFSINL